MGYAYVKATPQHRLAGLALDAVLMFVTLYIGYIVWSLIIWGQGQTPGKQILRMRVYSAQNFRAATWGHMAVRQFLIPLTISLAGLVPILLFGGVGTTFDSDVSTMLTIVIVLIYISSLVFQLADAFWILKGNERRRIIDLWAKTDVLNECVKSEMNFANPSLS